MKLLAALLGSISLCAGTAQSDAIHSIQLKNRPADEVMPVIQPMLSANDSLTGQGFQLFIRTSNSNFEQIRQMVKQLDKPAKLLLISVFQGDETELRGSAVSGHFEYQGSDAGIAIGSPGGSAGNGTSVNYGTGDATAGIHTFSTRGRRSDSPLHQLRVTAGSEGYIETGQSIPYFSGGHWAGGRHGVLAGRVDYKNINTGFYVLPRINGNQVTLDISPYKQSQTRDRSDGNIRTQSSYCGIG